MSTRTSPNARLHQLDLLRGVAIIFVLICHSSIRGSDSGIFNKYVDAFMNFGWTGVDLFFVLSGFLVGGLLFKELKSYGKVHVGRFLIRRGLKIWPVYFAYLAYYVAKGLHRGWGIGGTWGKLYPNFFHIQDYVESAPAHTWSLAVEEHFYLALPILVWLLTERFAPSRSSAQSRGSR